MPECSAPAPPWTSEVITFAPDQRMADAQRVTDYLAGRAEALQQQWLDGRSASNKARAKMVAEMKRSDPTPTGIGAGAPTGGPPGSYPLIAGEGNACTINGEDGTLVREGNYLVCKPKRQAAQPSHDTDPRAEAYMQMVADLDFRTRSDRNA